MTRISLVFIRVYQKTIGPILGLLSTCRYYPSCSQYGYEAISKFGWRRGWWLAMRRLSRCAPWGGHGEDPVPEQYLSWRERYRQKHRNPQHKEVM